MKFLLLLSLIALCYVSSCYGTDLIVGTSFNARLAHQGKVENMGIPFKKRVKEFFYADQGQQVIKGVIVRETEHTDASAIITAGGVGFTYVNLRFKSERGSGLYYHVEIYT